MGYESIYKKMTRGYKYRIYPNEEQEVLAANNIKRFAFRNINTVGTTEIHACGDMSEDAHSAQEAHESSVRG